MGCVVTGSALSKNLITFCVLRFFSGLANLGLFEIYIVWGILFFKPAIIGFSVTDIM
jgi:hypothetical protein